MLRCSRWSSRRSWDCRVQRILRASVPACRPPPCIVPVMLLRLGSDSCLMQDEPERGTGFSHKMSLKGKIGMLGIDHQHGRFRSGEPRRSGRFSPAAARCGFAGQTARGTIRLGGKTLVRQQYASLNRRHRGKGLVRSYISRLTGRAQVTRLITAYEAKPGA